MSRDGHGGGSKVSRPRRALWVLFWEREGMYVSVFVRETKEIFQGGPDSGRALLLWESGLQERNAAEGRGSEKDYTSGERNDSEKLVG